MATLTLRMKAWELLHERFENKKVNKRNHLKTLIEWPKMAKQSHALLRQLLGGLQLHWRALKPLLGPIDAWHSIIIFIFSDKLNLISSREWRKFFANIDCRFLTKRFRFLGQDSDLSVQLTDKILQSID